MANTTYVLMATSNQNVWVMLDTNDSEPGNFYHAWARQTTSGAIHHTNFQTFPDQKSAHDWITREMAKISDHCGVWACDYHCVEINSPFAVGTVLNVLDKLTLTANRKIIPWAALNVVCKSTPTVAASKHKSQRTENDWINLAGKY